MFEFQTFTVLLCAIGVLTSSVSKTDGSRNETRLDHEKNVHNSEDDSTSVKSEIKSHELSDDKAPLKIMGEGGPIYQSKGRIDSLPSAPKTAPLGTVVSDGIKITTDDLIPLDSEAKEPKIRNPSVVPRKGVIPPSKIAARKGVGLESFIPDVSPPEGVDEALSRVVPSIGDTKNKKTEQISLQTSNNTKESTIKPKALPDHSDIAIPAIDKTSNSVPRAKNNSASPSESANVAPTIETKIVNATTTSSPTASTRRFKPKPTVTIGEMNVDKPIPASPTKTPPLGMPRKIDYIVPVIITIMALPLLGGAAFFMYRRGRDCWDKRHYRRMDFLIDGMYNDHTSWK